MSVQVFAFVLAFPFLFYSAIEDLKYRAVMPLPLFVLIGVETIGRVILVSDIRSIYHFVLLSVFFAAIHKTWPQLLPEADVYILVAAMSALWEPWTLYVFIIALAAVDVLVRAMYAMMGKGADAFTKMPLPLAPEAFAAFIVVFVAYISGSLTVLSSVRW